MKFFAFIGRFSIFIFAAFLPVFIALVWFNVVFLKPYDKSAEVPVSVEIPKNASIDEVAEVLAESGAIRNSFAGKFLLQRIQKKHETPLVIKEGEYEILPSLTPSEVLEQILESKTVKRTFRITEGDTFHDIAESIEKAGLFAKDVMVKAMTQRGTMLKLKLNAGIPEGYFLPGEFTFSKPITPEQVFESMIKRSQQEFDRSFENIGRRLERMHLDYYQLITLASILEKEGGSLEMKKLISSVYHNRLALQVPLESDEVLAYGLKKKSQDITPRDRDIRGPYNTHSLSGLPATPICTPGKDSLSAALFPTRSDFLYFLPKPNSPSNFSYRLDEHLAKQKRQ